MVFDPEKRPSAHLLLQHPYFEDIAENQFLKKAGGHVGHTDDLLSPPILATLAAVQENREE